MVTLASMLTMLSMSCFILTIDVLLFDVSYGEAISLMFDGGSRIGKNILLSAAITGILGAAIIDWRRWKNSTPERTAQ